MIYMAVELRCYLTPAGKIHISGGKCGNYDKSLSGKRIPEGSMLMEVEEIVLDFSDFTGIPNNSGSGKTGDIMFTTVGASSDDVYNIIIQVSKSYG